MTGQVNKELQAIRIGYLPLTDCASLLMAVERGFDRQYGIRIVLSRETSWASVRDKLGSGALDAAHVLYGLVYGVQLGIGCQQKDMAVLMNLSQNGQSVTLSRALAQAGAVDGPGLARCMLAPSDGAPSLPRSSRPYTFAQTFPTGNHAMLLNYWLAANGIHPLRDARTVTVPPTQMVSSLGAGMIDGFCAGEPWGQRAIADDTGVTVATSQQIWPDHPGKVLGTSAAFADRHPGACRALVAALLEAGRWIDASVENRRATAAVLARPDCLNLAAEAIVPRLLGQYEDGMGRQWQDSHALAFYRGGAVNFPYLSDGMWFMTQQRRWGLVKDEPDYLAVAQAVNRIALYTEAAALSGTPLPSGVMRSATLVDGVVWDGSDPAAYAASFAIHQR